MSCPICKQIKKYLRDNPQVINSKSILKRIIKLEREHANGKIHTG
jgi:hypothetical protein